MLFRKRKAETPDLPNASNSGVIAIQWGGYYTSKDAGKFGVFRLLDFNKDAYHVQLFQEKFDHAPSFDEVKDLKPFIWHAPIAVGGLLNNEGLTLIGYSQLDEASLAGYEEYLRQMGTNDTAIKEMSQRLIQYSSQAPMKVRLTKTADGIDVLPLA